MRSALLVGMVVVAAVAWAARGQAEEPKTGLAAQRARVLARLAELDGPLQKNLAIHREALLVRELSDSLKRTAEGIPGAGAPVQPKAAPSEPTKYEVAAAWLTEHEPLIDALQRKQADLYAEAIARGEQP